MIDDMAQLKCNNNKYYTSIFRYIYIYIYIYTYKKTLYFYSITTRATNYSIYLY